MLNKGLITMMLVAGLVGFDGSTFAQAKTGPGATAAQGGAATPGSLGGNGGLERFGYHGDVIWGDGRGASVALDTVTGAFTVVLGSGALVEGLLTMSKSAGQLTASIQVAGGPRVHVPIRPRSDDDGAKLPRFEDLMSKIVVVAATTNAAQGGAVQPN